MRKILKDYGIRIAFRTGCTLAKLLTRVKDPTKKGEIMGAVYKIKCICGDFYIGESGRALGERIKEHKAACKYAHFDKSPVAEHVWKDGDHQINWDDVDIIDRAQGMTERSQGSHLYWFGSPRLNFEQRHWFRTITHHHESCQGPTVTEVNKHLDNSFGHYTGTLSSSPEAQGLPNALKLCSKVKL